MRKQSEIRELTDKLVLAVPLIKPAIAETAPIGIIDFNKWEWTQGVGLFTMWQYYILSENDEVKQIIFKWFSDRFAEGLPDKNINTMCPMLTMMYVYEETRDEKYLPYLHEWADYALNKLPRTKENGLQHIVSGMENKEQLWADTLYMTGLFMAKYGGFFNKQQFTDESVYQFLLHIKYLTDKKTGLWYHGWSFKRGDNFANALWARGNSWFTAAVPDFFEIAEIPVAAKKLITNSFVGQVDALCECQHNGGLWHTLLDDPGSYTESSASANFAYGIIKGIRLGLLSADYLPVAEKAINAIIGCVDSNGIVGQVSYGTGMGQDKKFYKDIPLCPMPYGQTLAARAPMEYLRYYTKAAKA